MENTDIKEKTIEQLENEKALLQEKLRKVQLQREIDELNRQIEHFEFPSRYKYFLKDNITPTKVTDYPFNLNQVTCSTKTNELNEVFLEDLINYLTK